MAMKPLSTVPGLDKEAERALLDYINRLTLMVNAQGATERLTSLQTASYLAKEGEIVRIKAGLTLTLPRARAENQNREIGVLIETSGTLRVTVNQGQINNGTFWNITGPGLSYFRCNGSTGWYCTNNGTQSSAVGTSTATGVAILDDGVITVNPATKVNFVSGTVTSATATNAGSGQANVTFDLATIGNDSFLANTSGGVSIPTVKTLTSLAGDGLVWDAVNKELDINGSTSITITSDQVQRSALAGDITAALNVNTTAFRSFGAKSVLANATNAGAVPSDLAGSTAFQHLRVNSTNTGLEWSVFTTGDFPANSVPLSAFPTMAANTFLANVTAGVAVPTAASLATLAGGGLVYSGGIIDVGSSTSILVGASDIQRQALSGDITAATNVNTTAFRTFGAKSVLANAINSSAVPSDLAGSGAFQYLRVNSANNGLEWATITVANPITQVSGTIGFDQTVALGNNARVAISKNGAAITGTRRQVNLIEGSNITMTVADDSANEKVDVTINASGGGGGVTGLLNLTEVEVSLGSSPVWSGTFQITGLSGLSVGTNVLIHQSNGPYTGKGTLADEAEEQVSVSGKVTSATTIDCYWESINGPVVGNFKFVYAIGASLTVSTLPALGELEVTATGTLTDQTRAASERIIMFSGAAPVLQSLSSTSMQRGNLAILHKQNAGTLDIIDNGTGVSTNVFATYRNENIRMMDDEFLVVTPLDLSSGATDSQRWAVVNKAYPFHNGPSRVNGDVIAHNGTDWQVVAGGSSTTTFLNGNSAFTAIPLPALAPFVQVEDATTGTITLHTRSSDERHVKFTGGAATVLDTMTAGNVGDIVVISTRNSTPLTIMDGTAGLGTNQFANANDKDIKIGTEDFCPYMYLGASLGITGVQSRWVDLKHTYPFFNSTTNVNGDLITHNGTDWAPVTIAANSFPVRLAGSVQSLTISTDSIPARIAGNIISHPFSTLVGTGLTYSAGVIATDYTPNATYLHMEEEFLSCSEQAAVSTTPLSFFGETGWWTVATAGTGHSVTASTGSGDHPGQITLTTNATVAQGVYIGKGKTISTTPINVNAQNYEFEWIVRLTPTTTSTLWRIGMSSDILTATLVQGVYFERDTSVDNLIHCFKDNGTGRVDLGTTADPGTNWVRLRATSVGSTLTYFVNGSQIATTSTSIPAGATNLSCMLFNRAGATRTLLVDRSAIFLGPMGSRT